MKYGFNQLSTCSSVIYDHSDVLVARYPFVAITCIDSGSPCEIFPQYLKLLSDNGVVYKLVQDALILQTIDLIKAHEFCNLFNGFDEVQFFNIEPAGSLILGSKLMLLEVENDSVRQIRIEDAYLYMLDRSCSLAIADGCGLNYIAMDDEILLALGNHAPSGS